MTSVCGGGVGEDLQKPKIPPCFVLKIWALIRLERRIKWIFEVINDASRGAMKPALVTVHH